MGARGGFGPPANSRESFHIMAIARSEARLLHHAAGLFNINHVDAVQAADGSIVFAMGGGDNTLNAMLRVGTLAPGGSTLGGIADIVIPQAAGGLPFSTVQPVTLSAGPDGRIAALFTLPEHGMGAGDLDRGLWMQRLDGGVVTGDMAPVSPADPTDRPSIYSQLIWLADGGFGVLTVDETTVSAIANPVTWQRFDADGTARGAAVTVVADGPAGGFGGIDRNPTMQDAAMLANGRIALTWTESSAFAAPSFGQPQVMMQIIREDGSVVLPPVVVDATSAQRSQVVALEGGGFVVAWLDYEVGTQGTFKAQVFGSAGRAQGDVFALSSTLSPQEGDLSLRALDNGGFAAVWRDMQDQTWLGRMFDARGTATGADFLVLDNAGDFIVGTAGLVAHGDTLTAYMHGIAPGVGSGFVLQAQDWSTQSSWGLDRDGTGGADTLSGGGADDILSGRRGGDVLKGGAGNDMLDGGAGRDRVTGGDGRDRIEGGSGRDTLTGGAGGDSFVFRAAGDGPDRITDFNGSEGDRLVFFKDGFGGAMGVLSGATVNSAHRGLFFETTTGILSYDADGTGAEARVVVARLVDVSALAFDDLVFL